MKGFFIEIKNNLLEKKHIENMDNAVWLYMWCLDKMTSISEEGIGKILGGKPIKFKEVIEELGISHRTYTRWVERLKKFGYINTIQAPYGLIISVNKAVKVFNRVAKNSERVAKNGKRYATSGYSNIRQYSDSTKTSGFKSFKELTTLTGEKLARISQGAK